MPATPPDRAAERAAERETDWAGLERDLLRLAGVFGFMLLPWLGANIAIPVGEYGVPLTLQTLAVVLAAVCIGPRLGMAAMVGYLTLGACGLPVFSDGGHGPGVLLGANGGYLLGFVLCQPVIGAFIKRRDGTIRGWGAMIAGMLVGHVVIFGIGVPWLWAALRFWVEDPAVTWWSAFYSGCLIFIPFMVVKIGIAVVIGRVAAPWGSRRFW
ncbi:MAG: biotin transporter BioY [Phycisphaeraceae bacterium]|nr:MAG: biotin transporter BioY [Phycisphaeraceae bacterium]